MLRLWSIALAAVFLGFAAEPTWAGAGRCEEEEISKARYINGGLLMSKVAAEIKNIEKEYKARGETLEVVIVARTGTDPGGSKVLRDFHPNGQVMHLDDYAPPSVRAGGHVDANNTNEWHSHLGTLVDRNRKITYSHLGLAFRRHPKGEWYFIHELNPCQTKTSHLYDESLWMFFLDEPYDYGAMVIVPTPEFQQRLYEVAIRDQMTMNFHSDRYNALALPYQTYEQNSNQWALELMAAAQMPRGQVRDRAEAQRVLWDHGYLPTRMRLSAYHQMGQLFGPKSISFRDQKYGGQGLVEIVTVLSIREYLYRNRLVEKEVPLYLADWERVADDAKK